MILGRGAFNEGVGDVQARVERIDGADERRDRRVDRTLARTRGRAIGSMAPSAHPRARAKHDRFGVLRAREGRNAGWAGRGTAARTLSPMRHEWESARPAGLIHESAEHARSVSAPVPAERSRTCFPGAPMPDHRLVLDEHFCVVEGLDAPRRGLICYEALAGHPAPPCAEVRLDERRRLQSQLAHQEKMAAFGLFAAGVAHEIGNPLAAISSELELLGGEQDLAVVQTSLRQMGEHVARISRILRELVDFARRRRDTETDLSLNSVVTDTLRLIGPDPRMRGVVLTTELDPDIPAVRLVEDHLVQVVLNLVLNALDAMPNGGELAIRTRHAAGEVILEVTDTGVGMSEEVRARAFEPLFTTKPEGKGTGLGLSICADVMAAAKGRIEVVSEPGAGARFSVILPARGAEDE